MSKHHDEKSIENLEALGKLAGRLGHDFNNILASIQGCKEIIQLRLDAAFPNGNPCERQLKLIETTVQKGVAITGKIRGFLRPGPIETEPVLLHEIVEAAAQNISKSGITREDIEVVVRSEPLVRANAFFVTQVLTGICLNAIDAMENQKDRTLIIFVDTKELVDGNASELTPGIYACISIVDHGRGMTAEIKKKLFEPFFSTKGGRVGGGFGLDLAMAEGIMQRHHGAVEIESLKDSGTVVHVYLPVANSTPTP